MSCVSWVLTWGLPTEFLFCRCWVKRFHVCIGVFCHYFFPTSSCSSTRPVEQVQLTAAEVMQSSWYWGRLVQITHFSFDVQMKGGTERANTVFREGAGGIQAWRALRLRDWVNWHCLETVRPWRKTNMVRKGNLDASASSSMVTQSWSMKTVRCALYHVIVWKIVVTCGHYLSHHTWGIQNRGNWVIRRKQLYLIHSVILIIKLCNDSWPNVTSWQEEVIFLAA